MKKANKDMQTIVVQIEEGRHACDIPITREEWLAILQDEGLKDSFREALLCFYYMPAHRGTCTAVAEKMRKKAKTLNILIRQLGERVQKIYQDRFDVRGVDSEKRYWIIPMNNGREVENVGKGVFEWELRKELADALRDYLYGYLVERYKLFRREVPIDQEGRGYEKYKWELITSSKGKTPMAIVADHMAHPRKSALGGFDNLIDASRDNKSLKYLLAKRAKEFEEILVRLADERTPLNDRLADYKRSVASLLPSKGYDSKANDERTAATILTCLNPSKYTFYKHDGLYAHFCEYLGVEMQKTGRCYDHYLTLIAPLAKRVKDDKELQEIVSPSLMGMKKSNMLLAQDIIYVLMVTFQSRLGYVYNLLYNTETDMDDDKINEYIELLEANHNLILTGAPGTGKTYLAKQMAVKMLGLQDEEELECNERFGFVQFHPSYDYTDFVEGIRPGKDAQSFHRQDGVFKEFCKRVLLSEFVDDKTVESLNNNPTVWKVSLEGAGENPTRTDCLANDYIRIGWDEYGDVDDFTEYDDFSNGGKHILRAFQKEMRIGDLVVSCYSAKEIDAIGVVTGEYEYRPEGGHYPRYRTVRWLVKNIRENIVSLNNDKSLTQSTIYKTTISVDAVLEIVRKYSAYKDNEPRKKNAVFIIDEINRGEISKILGELFFSIDPNYRGMKGRVKTQYQNMVDEGDVFKHGFFVPENVYIIGTMNDIDRSVESMDFAMRRRFAWREVSAKESQDMLDHIDGLEGAPIEEIKVRMDNLNVAIVGEYKYKDDTERGVLGLGPSFQIGAAYFAKYAAYKDSDAPFTKLWDYHLKSLLAEYLRGNADAEKELSLLKEAYEDNGTNSNDGQ